MDALQEIRDFGIAAVVVGSGAICAATTKAASTANTPPTYVVKIAYQQAKENGDPTPTRSRGHGHDPGGSHACGGSRLGR